MSLPLTLLISDPTSLPPLPDQHGVVTLMDQEKTVSTSKDGAEVAEDPTTPAPHPPHISVMEPLTREAYGGGLYGTDDDGAALKPPGPPASATQSADGPAQQVAPPKHKPPPSTGDRDLDITGQSYIQ